MQKLQGMLFDEKSADVIIIVEGKRFPPHKILLIAPCVYFKWVKCKYSLLLKISKAEYFKYAASHELHPWN